MKTVFFDLDGTLLPMRLSEFSSAYFAGISGELARLGYRNEEIRAALGGAILAVLHNRGGETNETVFLSRFAAIAGERIYKDAAALSAYYATRFDEVRKSCGFEPRVAPFIAELRARGVQLVLATNPIFPRVATERRLAWAGLSPEDFAYISTYENSSYCKPSPAYFKEILTALSLDPADCLMVGNDATEDMAASEAGLSVFLLCDCLENAAGRDISTLPHGDFEAMRRAVTAFVSKKPTAP